MRFVTPYSADVKVVQHTIQLVPRLPEPALVTAVLVQPDVPVKKGQPLFQFDRRPYEYQVRQLEAQLDAVSAAAKSSEYKVQQSKAGLAAANQDVQMYKADLDAAQQKVVEMKSERNSHGISCNSPKGWHKTERVQTKMHRSGRLR